jgi:predicted DNA-binding protein (UPF0251 family)
MTIEEEQRRCIDCGNESTGLRCKVCHGKYIAERALAETAVRDAQVLDMVDREHLSGQRLADRLGISRTRTRKLIARARQRAELRGEVSA